MEDKGQGKEATSSSSKPPCGSVLNRKTQRSVQFEQHVREAFLVQPNLTEKKFPAMANTLVWAYLGHLLENKVITLAGHFEMDDLMNEVIAVTPSAPTVASIITECGEIDDFYLSKELDKLVVIYACFDGGNKKGRKFEFQLEAGWDPVLRHNKYECSISKKRSFVVYGNRKDLCFIDLRYRTWEREIRIRPI
eukprot:CAMPEP_0185763120 /NCGR_PEP_ID=MMETSP1174-20130828/22074_1 /TAXON_ID=35687 /ORGANISM="Dictyocha speculum, Strain CCMP1381" /LENGTH=192 /DNA_ID=CAMNT_0028445105 /DNA_START=605 /DNA_END=1183 /DNA_ORIENTATION=+